MVGRQDFFTHWNKCYTSLTNDSHSSWKITSTNRRGDGFGQSLTSGAYVRQAQINRAPINSAPANIIKLNHNIIDNTIRTDNGYPFLDRVDLMNLISSQRKHLDEILRARWTRVLIKLIFRYCGQNESHLEYRPEKVGFLYTEVRKALGVLCPNTSRKGSRWLDSLSTVNFKEGCIEINCARKKSASFSRLNKQKVSST